MSEDKLQLSSVISVNETLTTIPECVADSPGKAVVDVNKDVT